MPFTVVLASLLCILYHLKFPTQRHKNVTIELWRYAAWRFQQMERERRVIKMQHHIHDAIHRSTVIHVLEYHFMPFIHYGWMSGWTITLLYNIIWWSHLVEQNEKSVKTSQGILNIWTNKNGRDIPFLFIHPFPSCVQKC